jgi:hypothetical protein
MIADYMFWGGQTYNDRFNTRVPRVTYRCKAKHEHPNHTCKIVTDHPDEHRCICGETWT